VATAPCIHEAQPSGRRPECAAASLKKILFSPELAIFAAELHKFSAIDTGLTNPLDQAAHRYAETLGYSSAGQPLSLVVMAFLLSTCSSNRGKPDSSSQTPPATGSN